MTQTQTIVYSTLEWMNEWVNEWMNEWMNEFVSIIECIYTGNQLQVE